MSSFRTELPQASQQRGVQTDNRLKQEGQALLFHFIGYSGALQVAQEFSLLIQPSTAKGQSSNH